MQSWRASFWCWISKPNNIFAKFAKTESCATKGSYLLVLASSWIAALHGFRPRLSCWCAYIIAHWAQLLTRVCGYHVMVTHTSRFAYERVCHLLLDLYFTVCILLPYEIGIEECLHGIGVFSGILKTLRPLCFFTLSRDYVNIFCWREFRKGHKK